MKTVGIYKITNTIDGKIYIGQTVNYEKRKTRHLNSLKNGNHHNEHLQKSFNKYGEDQFKIELIQECKSEELDELEKLYIKDLNACDCNKGYNMMHGGQIYREFTKEVRMKMSKTRKGVKLSEEHKLKIGLAQRGKVIHQDSIDKSIETKKRLKIHCGEKNPNALISNKVAEKIILDLIEGIAVNSISNKHQVSNDIVYNIMYNRSYTHIMPDVREELQKRTSIALDNKIQLSIEMYLKGHSQNEISKALNISRNTLRRELKARGINPQKCVNQYIKHTNTEVINQIAKG